MSSYVTSEQFNALINALTATLDQMLDMAAIVGRLEKRIAVLEQKNNPLQEEKNNVN